MSCSLKREKNKQPGYSFSLSGFLPGLSYMPAETPFHRMHPLIKLELLICYSILVFSLPHYLSALCLFVILLAAYQAAGLGLAFFWRKLKFIIMFSALIFIVHIIFVHEGVLLWQAHLLGLRLQIWSLGLFKGLSLVFRFVNIICSSYLFVATTDPNRLAYCLMQAGLPYRFGFMLITSLRFIPVFFMELSQVRNAQMAKGIDLEGLSLKKFSQMIRYLFVPLVISALSKVDTLTISMESRAFGLYQKRTYLDQQPFTRANYLQAVFTAVISLVFYLLMRSFTLKYMY